MTAEGAVATLPKLPDLQAVRGVGLSTPVSGTCHVGVTEPAPLGLTAPVPMSVTVPVVAAAVVLNTAVVADLGAVPVVVAKSTYAICVPDRMVDPAIMARVQTNLSVSFSMDAACNPHGTNALCPRYATPSTFTTQCVSGEALWCCAPAHEVREYQQRYKRSKRKDPHHTCAVFVVPKFPHLTGYFSQLRYKLVEEFPTGTTLFVSANGGKARLPMPPTPFPIQLW